MKKTKMSLAAFAFFLTVFGALAVNANSRLALDCKSPGSTSNDRDHTLCAQTDETICCTFNGQDIKGPYNGFQK